jgi:pyrroline-5-carboxylate reductase
MGEALLAGLLAAGRTPSSIGVAEADPGRRADLERRFPGVVCGDAPMACDGAVIAVKPPDAPAACAALAPFGPRRVLSIAAGVTTARLEEALGGSVAVVRAMPNTPAQVGAGASAVAPGAHATDADLEWAEELLGAVGVVVRVDEDQLDAVTGLSGSGPAYVFLLVEALIDAGVRQGLPVEVAGELVVQTIAGAAQLLAATGASGTDAHEHRLAVTSPQGTTAAGLAVLEVRDVRAAVAEAVAAATERSRQLGAG